MEDKLVPIVVVLVLIWAVAIGTNSFFLKADLNRAKISLMEAQSTYWRDK